MGLPTPSVDHTATVTLQLAPDLDAYDIVLVNSSVGKDSQASLDFVVEHADLGDNELQRQARGDAVIRWPNGDIWIPTPMPLTGLFGTPTRRDWQHHARATIAQARALARVVTLYDSHRADAQRISQLPNPHQ